MFTLAYGEKTKTNVSQLVTINNHVFLLHHPPHSESPCCSTYTDGGILVQLVFGCNTEACAVAASGPGEVHCCLQLVAHLLVDGASKLSTIVALKIISTGEISHYTKQNLKFLTKRRCLLCWGSCNELIQTYSLLLV